MHNGNITIKQSHSPALAFEMKRETLLLLTKHCFRNECINTDMLKNFLMFL